MLEVFNRPGSEFSCAKRDETTVTPQVFALFNSQFVHDRALALADRVSQEQEGSAAQVTAVFRRILGRAPSDEERDLAITHVQEMTQHHRDHPPEKVEPPRSVMRGMVEELTGKLYRFEDRLTLMDEYVGDLKPWQASPETRGLAELCLVLMNSNELVDLY